MCEGALIGRAGADLELPEAVGAPPGRLGHNRHVPHFPVLHPAGASGRVCWRLSVFSVLQLVLDGAYAV